MGELLPKIENKKAAKTLYTLKTLIKRGELSSEDKNLIRMSLELLVNGLKPDNRIQESPRLSKRGIRAMQGFPPPESN